MKDKVSQQDAFQAALEQVYPREEGYWYLDCATSQFGLWVNGYGGRKFTESELSSGKLETAIVTPNKTFAVDEPLPMSGVITGTQQGGMQYGVNGFYANFGITGWLCSDGDRFTWGLGEDDGIPDWDEEGGEVWQLTPNFTGDANVIAALSACDALTSGSSPEQIAAARAAYKAIPATFWNGAYAQFLFRTYEPYKTAYDNLLAAEAGSGITNPLPTVTAAEALSDTLAAIKTAVPSPVFGNEWTTLALARGGMVDNGYYAGYLTDVAEYVAGLDSNQLDENKSTENARLILALSSLGKDATGAGGKDLVAPFGDFEWTGNQGINGVAFALLALDSKGYDEEDAIRGAFGMDELLETETIGDGLIKLLLDAQHDDGGWALDDGNKEPEENKAEPSNVDMTAMVIQALAPYYFKSGTVTAATDEGLTWLKTQQRPETGGFAGWGGAPENSTESDAQVVVALTALGLDPESWEVAGGWNPLAALLDNYVTGGFSKDGGGAKDDMSTEQAAYALVAYDRFKSGKNPLYQMSDAVAPGEAIYTVTFNANGGSVTEKGREIVRGAAVGALPVPVRSGYRFEGWFTAANGGAKIAAGTVVNGAVTYYAHWTAVYKVTFDSRGGSAVAEKLVDQKKAVGDLATPNKTGYKFGGWYTKASGGTKITAKTVPTKDITYYAQWSAKSVKVTHDANKGKNLSVKTKTVTYDSKYGALATATRTGHTFNGWYTEKTGGTKVTKNTTVKNEKAHTLYAQWTAKKYKATFDANRGKIPVDGGGAVMTKKVTVTYAAKFGDLPVPTRSGYEFKGWWTEKNDGTKITKNTKVTITKNTKYYAHWKKK
ncbi:MAG: InlB B-repeat-containing protein [Clostridiales Family XIII bacterium]|nr:InlB B-repeat-containing protein [Clostridiales Family XIII bacterium]